MAIRGKPLKVNFLVWDTENNCGKTGVASSITLRYVKDSGPPSPVSNTVSEVDPVNMKGIYRVTLDANEMDGDFICVSGVVSGAQNTGVVVYPAFIQTESGELGKIYALLDDIKNTMPTDLSNLATKTDLDTAENEIKESANARFTAIETQLTDIQGAIPADLADIATKTDLDAVKTSITAMSSEITQIKSKVTDTDALIKEYDNFGVKLNDIGIGNVAQGAADFANSTPFAELPAGAPAAAPTLSQAVMLLYMALRNKTENSQSIMKIFNSSGAPIAAANLQDINSVFTKSQLSSTGL